ncbi:Putative uncharacterized protein [Moritella viscosa]|uniref:Uncharacterized protein n=1 Tax=Moritella viscosa TaxID=80854 RepID=A0A1L0AC14_9GAMM|nr:Putative uncharacterized protein [Moritella viscosa]SHO12748.1 Putative uncharacterized protein [Moritella viscosa]SHO13976.1 Putative uncharacterized protein [Moritella viscosa]SHO16729.1 Putative uncharacterized protein [Moritella viscosa]SHO23469.1 Putative uncharacterized protein [Moritella viscosa]
MPLLIAKDVVSGYNPPSVTAGFLFFVFIPAVKIAFAINFAH